MSKLIVLKGIIHSGKTKLAKILAEEYNAKIIDFNNYKESLIGIDDSSILNIMTDVTKEYLNDNINVIFNYSNCGQKRDNIMMDLGINLKAEVICEYVVKHPYLWEKTIQQQYPLSFNSLVNTRHSMYEALNFPSYTRYDIINFHIDDILEPLIEFQDFYEHKKGLFINNPKKFFELLKEKFGDVFPELDRCINFNQENSHHLQTLDNHLFSVAKYLSMKTNREELIWAGILHDLGKATLGIKQYSKEDNATYRGHAGASTEIGICVLKRFGFSNEFIYKVMSIVNKHMYLPYEGTLSSKKIKALDSNLYSDLLLFREADKNSKKMIL